MRCDQAEFGCAELQKFPSASAVDYTSSLSKTFCIPFALCTLLLVSVALHAESPQSISNDEFEQLHGMIKPQAGESRWMEIDWHPNIWEARQRAAAEGKPIFMMAGSGGAPTAGC